MQNPPQLCLRHHSFAIWHSGSRLRIGIPIPVFEEWELIIVRSDVFFSFAGTNVADIIPATQCCNAVWRGHRSSPRAPSLTSWWPIKLINPFFQLPRARFCFRVEMKIYWFQWRHKACEKLLFSKWIFTGRWKNLVPNRWNFIVKRQAFAFVICDWVSNAV